MNELDVEVTIDEDEQKGVNYRFSHFPLQIGRDPDCHLSICHESIARKLCNVWISKEGLIYVEEYPRLTNPIFRNGQIVTNGARAKHHVLQIGPVRIELRHPNDSKRQATISPANTEHRRRFPRRPIVLILAASLLLPSMFWFQFISKHAAEELSINDFPSAIPFDFNHEPASSHASADMLMQLAKDNFMRQPSHPARQKTAIETMWVVTRLAPAGSPLEKEANQLLTQWKSALNASYRLEIIRFVNAMRAGDQKKIETHSNRLFMYIGHVPSQHKFLVEPTSTSGRQS